MCWLSSYIFFNVYVLNVCVRFIWLNLTYNIPTFYRATLWCDRAIVPTLCYNKWPIMWCFIFVCIIINNDDFISDFIVVVNAIIIFADIVFINFSALADVLISNPPYVLSVESYHGQIIIGTDYKLLTYLLLI